MTRFIISAVIAGALAGFLNSVPAQAQGPDGEASSDVYFERIAVAPVLVGHRRPNMDETLDDTLSCPIDQICAEDAGISPDAGPALMRLAHSHLKRRFGSHVAPLDSVQAAYAGIRLDGSKDSPRTLALRLGEAVPADLVLVVTLWRFRDRGAIDGFPDKPASVAFALYLVDAKTGRLLWRGIFDDAQEVALNDLARFSERIKMGLTWLSADELADHGVEAALRRFPRGIKPRPERNAG